MRAREIEWIEPDELASGWRGRGLAWLDGDGEGAQGRWSFVACAPVEVREAHDGDPAPLAVLRGVGGRPADGELDPAMVPAWIGHVGYDAAWSMAPAIGLRSGTRHARDPIVPVARFARYDAVIALDRIERRAWIAGDDDDAIARARVRIEARDRAAPWARAGEVASDDPALHRDAIAGALERIAAGEIYQVNLVRRWIARFEGDPIALFLAMRRASPVPFGAYLEDRSLGGGGWAVLARTMERFLRYDARDRTLETRPIKGTIARAGDDRAEADALRADLKERAEHAMIVDLMRNDLGRIARIGSVRALDLMSVEPYAGLSHLVSTVRAIVREEVDLEGVLEATFPPGSITGTPKLRAMELIEALEQSARGVAFGAVGHVDRAGGLSLAVAIRTATVAGGEARYAAGGGLVEASVIEREVAETELKARVFLDAVTALGHAEAEGRAKNAARLSGVV